MVWRAADPGPQVIRLNFDQPQSIHRIRLEFREERKERSQEFAVFASSAKYQRREVVRQQWGFSLGGSAVEIEDYRSICPLSLCLSWRLILAAMTSRQLRRSNQYRSHDIRNARLFARYLGLICIKEELKLCQPRTFSPGKRVSTRVKLQYKNSGL